MKPGRSSGRVAVLRLVGLFALLGMVPLALLTYFTIHLADRAVVREVNARVRTTSAVSALLLQQQMQAVTELATSYASRPILIDALGDGDPTKFNNDVISAQLAQLHIAGPGIGGVFLTDASCRLTQVEPATPAIVGVDFSFRDWCKGVRATGEPYVSEAYETAIVGNPLVVAAAVMVRPRGGDEGAQPLGILAAVYTLDAIQAFTDEVARVQGIHLTITDQRATLLVAAKSKVGSGGLVSAAGDRRVQAALEGRSGVVRSSTAEGDSLSAYAPVGTIGWTVTAEVPSRQALAGVRNLRSTVLSVASVLALALLAGMFLLARAQRLRRRAEVALVEREGHTRAILEAATDAFISMDAAGLITAWNGQAHATFGWTETEALGRLLAETIIPPEHREDHERGLARFLASGEGPILNQRLEVTALHKDGHQFPAELAIWPVTSESTWSFNAFVHDITDRKRADVDLAEARDRALEASRLKSEFLANMSHEIRTPMNGVLGMTSLLLDSELNADQRVCAETVLASGEALLSILNDILDFSKIEAGHLELESIDFDLRALVEDVASLLSLAAHEKGLELACSVSADTPVAVRGDPGRLRQVLTNLVGNAVKFTPSGEVVVKITVDEGDEAAAIVRFEVVDTGIGIDAGVQEAIFDSFAQADAATTRRFGGTGLGLAISRQLVELMDGHIGVDSELGRGSTFWFTISLEQAPRLKAPGERVSLENLNMLVVDDNATNRAILSRLLDSWGVRSEAVEGAPQALAAMARSAAGGTPFDAALLDLNMPEVDGIELARRIAADTTLPRARLILLTSSGQRGEASQSREAGIDAYLTKPVRPSALYDCLVAVMDPTRGTTGVHVAVVVRAQPASQPNSGRILVAEDNLVNQRVVTSMLENLGFQFDVVGDGSEAVRAATSTLYRAILMDCHMPVKDGYQATSEIRRLPGEAGRTPIIAVTASAMKSDEQRCREAGMDDVVTKPLSLQTMTAVLARWAPQGAQSIIADDAGHELRPGPACHLQVLDAAVVGRLECLGRAAGEDLMGQLAGLFLTDADVRMATLRQALLENDAPAVVRCAHTLRGASANLGATELARLCADLESDGEIGDLASGELVFETVEVELDRVRCALRLV